MSFRLPQALGIDATGKKVDLIERIKTHSSDPLPVGTTPSAPTSPTSRPKRAAAGKALVAEDEEMDAEIDDVAEAQKGARPAKRKSKAADGEKPT